MNIQELANIWIEEHAADCCMTVDDFMHEQAYFYDVHASHISDCFVDTSCWVKGTDHTADELEAEIVRICKDGAK